MYDAFKSRGFAAAVGRIIQSLWDGALSAEATATGSEQSVPHLLGRTPVLCVAIPQRGHDGAGAAGTQMPTSLSYGTHTSTDAKVTMTAGCKFRVLTF